MDYAVYQEDLPDQLRYIWKIDTGSPKEQVAEYTGLLSACGADLQKTETTDTGVTWYFAYNGSVFAVGYEPDMSYIMYDPELLSFE